MKFWNNAVREAAAEEPADITETARRELEELWYDLANAMRNAVNGYWSMQCDNIVARIIRLSRAVGATPWQQIQIPMLISGIYQGILGAAGIPFEPPDMREIRRIERDSQ